MRRASTRASAGQPLPVEFTLLRYRPEPWTPADSLSWAKMMAWSLSVNWETELLRARLIERLAPSWRPSWSRRGPRDWPVVMPSRCISRDTVLSDMRCAGPADSRPSRPPITRRPNPISAGQRRRWRRRSKLLVGASDGRAATTGSSPAGARQTGMPLLANDMHLLLSAPAIWYENHLVGTDDALNITGVTFPGIPYVVAGHNGHVAWGFTNGFPDVQDLYIERLRRSADGGVEYEYRGEWRAAEVRRENDPRSRAPRRSSRRSSSRGTGRSSTRSRRDWPPCARHRAY